MFRLLGKINIAVQLMLLVAVVAGLAICVVSWGAEDRSQRLLLARFRGSLVEESQLQGFTLRENLRTLSRELSDITDRNSEALRQGSPELRDQALRQVFDAPSERPLSVDEPVLFEACLVQRRPDGELLNRAVFRRKGRQVVPYPVAPTAVTNAAARLARERMLRNLREDGTPRGTTLRQFLSPLVQAEADDGARPIRPYLLAIAHLVPGDPTNGVYVVIATLDFTRLIENQARRLPRHLLFVRDEKGQWVYHPDEANLGKKTEEWKQPQRGANAEDPELVPEAGVDVGRLKSPGLGYYVIRQEISDELSEDPVELRQLEGDLLRCKGLRFSRLWRGMKVLSLSARTTEIVENARIRLAEADRRATRSSQVAPSRPIFCEVFMGHLLPQLVLDREQQVSVGVILAGAEDEMKSEVHDTLAQMWYRLILPVLLVSMALALGAAYVLTRPLRRLTEASKRLSLGDYSVDVQVVAPGEVGELARTFREMTNQIRTREREQREQKEQMNTILNNAADGIIAFDHTGRIQQANQAAEAMFGYEEGKLVGSKVQKLMRLPEHLQKPIGMPLNSATGSNTTGFGGMSQYYNAVKTPGEEHRGLRKDGSTFWMEVTFSQVGLEDRRLIIGIFRDVTQRKLAEERIRRMNDELDARVRLRTAELEDTMAKLELARNQAEAANATKDLFISIISHELRTPLTSAMGYTELLLNPRATKLRENPGSTLEKILTACRHLSTLINDLLDVSRYNAGKPIDLTPATFALGPFLQGVQEMVTPLVKKNGNMLETGFAANLGEIHNDETRLRQLLLNLLSNAAKFTENGKVSFQVERQRENGDWLIFRVSDTGAGMTPEQQERLFTPFYRVDNSTTRKQGGTGLGLTIAKMICEPMGGSISVESRPGQGSTFTVRVPALVTGKGARQSAGAVSGDGASATPLGTVLVIDDDATIRHMLETYLQQEGYRVVQAASGSEGLRLAREQHPTVITLDVLMPNEDGWDVLARLKNDPATRDIPVIMLTIMEERNRGFALGATEYVTKPIDWGRLGSLLHRYNPGHAPILIVEDDALQRGYLREGLALAGWNVLEASNGAEGLKICETTTPSLILLDLTMPIMDGFTFLDELRRREGGAAIPVVVATARELSDEERRKLNRSVAQVLAKESLAPEQLLERIREQMQTLGVGVGEAKVS